MELGLQGKTVLVTGGSKGIGLYSALQFVKEGAKVAIAARGEAGLAEAKAIIQEQTGVEIYTIVADISKEADCILLFSDLKRFDVFPIDVWVRRVMNDLYIKNEDEKISTTKAELEKIDIEIKKVQDEIHIVSDSDEELLLPGIEKEDIEGCVL